MIVTSLCAKKGLFTFSRAETTNIANWSEINRNGLHSLERLDKLEDNRITVSAIVSWFG